MGWNVLFLLHLFCAMAAMAGVHAQGNSTEEDVILNQAFEGEAVHSMMRSWLNAGTSPDLFNSSWGWYFEGHPCYKNNSRASSGMRDWDWIYCTTRSFQPEDSNLVQYHSLVQLNLDVDDYPSTPLVGELPPAIVNLTNLESLWISNARKLSGPLPAGLFCSSLVLRTVILSNCSFNGSIKNGFRSTCGGNEGLEYLNVSYNRIKGEFAIRTQFLEIVDISNNFITNITTFGEISTLTDSLRSIHAQNNSINRFPIEIFEYKTLQDIYLDSNSISNIVQDFTNINVSTLQRISMSKNKF